METKTPENSTTSTPPSMGAEGVNTFCLPTNWLHDLQQTFLNLKCQVRGHEIEKEKAFAMLMNLFQGLVVSQKNLWWVGNGGSAAMCSHLSQDCLNKLGIRSMPLSDASLLTCMANDFGYEEVYARPLRTLGTKGDMLVAVSSSGNSENILRAVKVAKELGMLTVSISGFSESNRLWNSQCEVSFFTPTSLYGVTEVAHEAVLHSVIESAWLKNGKKTFRTN